MTMTTVYHLEENDRITVTAKEKYNLLKMPMTTNTTITIAEIPPVEMRGAGSAVITESMQFSPSLLAHAAGM